jgi:hypothetical protein
LYGASNALRSGLDLDLDFEMEEADVVVVVFPDVVNENVA